MKKDIIKEVQVNLPLRMIDKYMDKFLTMGLNPEIGLDAISMDTVSLDKAEKISEKFRERNLKITMHGPFLDLDIASTDSLIREASRKRIYSAINFIKIFQPESVVFHSGYDYKRYSHIKEQWFDSSCDFWSEMTYLLKQQNVCLYLENVYERSPFEIKKTVQAVYENGGGFCFDTGHHYAFGKEKLDLWIEELGKYIKEVHLHDNDGKSDQHLPPGKGAINFKPLSDAFNSGELDAQITFEPHNKDDLFLFFDWIEKNMTVFFNKEFN
ncbi:MAG: hypothetical protein CSB21_03230 [Deltaproteobacteria bacterium]|nr:MAG: hypothetical protein CSB21_03230 [Deltaproteobacteria bacterium]